MSSQPPIGEIPSAVRAAPGEPVIRNINWGGLRTLYIKEVRRFFKVQLQTIWAPAVTTLLYLIIFTTALGGRHAVPVAGMQVPFADFIAPGLIVMGMMNNAFANASFSLLVGKIRYDRRLSDAAALHRRVVGGVGRRRGDARGTGRGDRLGRDGRVAGGACHPARLFAVLWFGLLGSVFLALLGVLTSIWAEKFDHAAAVTNFVVVPLSLLSGTFYSVDGLAPAFRAISHANPFFYVISGFRYGFLGLADSPVTLGGVVVLGIDAAMAVLCYVLLRKGWKLKN